MAHKFLTTDQLRIKLNVLSSPEKKFRFLELIYLPGYNAVVDLMIEINGEDLGSNILKKELEVAILNNNNELIKKYGKLFIDHYFKNEFVGIFAEELLALKCNILTQDALIRLPQSNSEEHLTEAARFYEKLGIQNQTTKELGDKLLKIELRDTKYPWKAANRLVKLGRYDEAINHYLKAGEPHHLHSAWGIAKVNVPDRKLEIAEMIFNLGLNKHSDELIYAECVKELISAIVNYSVHKENNSTAGPKQTIKKSYPGTIERLFLLILKMCGLKAETLAEISIISNQKVTHIEKRATDELKAWAAKQKPDSGRYFYSLVGALKIFNLTIEIDHILRLARKYTNSLEGYFMAQYEEMSKLCFIAGKIDESKDWVIKKLLYEIAQCNPSHGYQTIAVYEKLTGIKDESLEAMLFPLLEREEKYEEARKLALRLEFFEKARGYEGLIELLPVIPVSATT